MTGYAPVGWLKAAVFYEKQESGLPSELFLPARPIVGDFLSFVLSGLVTTIEHRRYFVEEVVLYCRTTDGFNPEEGDPVMAIWLAERKAS